MRVRFFVVAFSLFLLPPSPTSAQDSKENADFKLAINLYNDGMFDLAQEQLKQFIASYPSSAQGADARFYLGLAQLKLRKYDDARLTFQTFALSYPDNPKAPEAWWNVGESYAAVKNYREAALAFERVKVFHPKSKPAADALVRASTYFGLAGDRENARRVLRVVLQEYPSSSAVTSARIRLGQMYFEDGNLEQAQNELKRVIEGEPSAEARAQALLVLGNIDQSMGRSDLAEANYQEVLTKYPASSGVPGAHLSMGKLLAASGRFPEAVDQFRSVLAGKGTVDSTLNRDALVAMGDAYAALGDYPNARSSYEKFLSSAPADERSSEVLWKSASAAAGAGDFRASDEACTRLLKSAGPGMIRKRALVRLALNAQRENVPLQAVQYLGTYADQWPDDPSTGAVVLRSAEITERDLHDPLKASGLYEQIAMRYHNSPLVDDAIDDAARCYEQLKDYDRALQLYHELIDMYPGSEFRDHAESRVKMIATFETRDKDAGLEKLALLVGDVMTQTDKAGLAFRLGEIYFRDLKNYQAAAAQFTNAIEGGLKDNRLPEALYLRGRAYEFLSWKDPGYRQQAADAYKIFLSSFPGAKQADDAELALFSLNATRVDSAHVAYLEILARRPDVPHQEEMLLKIGDLEEKSGNTDAAMTTFSHIVQLYPTTPASEEAGFRRIGLFLSLGLTDSALSSGGAYVAGRPRGKYAAAVLDSLALVSLRLGQPQRAAGYYRQLETDFPYTTLAVEARRHLADALMASNDYTGATAIYAELLNEQSANPLIEEGPDPALVLAMGKACQAEGKEDDARKYLLDVVSRVRSGPLAAQAFTTLGLMEKNDGALDVATSYFRQAEAASPGSADSRDIADLFFDSENYADAIRLYTKLSGAASSDEERAYDDAKIIIAKLRTGGPQKAEADIAAFRKHYPDIDDYLASFELETGNHYFREKDYTRALRAFELVESKYDGTPSGPGGEYWIAKTLEVTDRAGDAVRHLNDLIKNHPTAPVIPKAYLTLGNIAYNAEKWDEAIKDYRRIVDDPKADPALLPLAMSNLIETYESAGAYDAALSLTRKYLEHYPNNDDSFDKRIKIGILYDHLGYYDQSILQLQSLLDEAGSDLEGELRYYIAEANFDKGDYQQAILDFLKVPYLVTKKGKIDWTANSFYMAGQSYEKMGRYDEALTMYRQIVERQGIDATFKAAARKEIDRVNLVLKKKPE